MVTIRLDQVRCEQSVAEPNSIVLIEGSDKAFVSDSGFEHIRAIIPQMLQGGWDRMWCKLIQCSACGHISASLMIVMVDEV